ncbi:DUF4350 domain-containing protein [Dinghuibacter silviterrae]|uniref:Uncharacterized protein DUF4350 n=1 Tax=Dinghuibacter silviterrae TaxID=1539049 RepID=A0A4R8DSS6_9BACT|nr:DUF4350 domain-containing protein [Dinghuibacter silviterrae]TDX00926.1 uncharacterized protein DUF4350 [Dinghuibacter silviterrae]
MKKNTFYIVLFASLGILLAGLIIFVVRRRSKEYHFDTTVTLSYRDKRPYGAYVAYNELSRVFPGTPVALSRRSGSFTNDLQDSDRHQLMVVLSPRFYANSLEWNQLIHWVRQGNYLVIAASRFTQDVKDQLHLQLSNFTEDAFIEEGMIQLHDDSLYLGLAHPPFADTASFFYPGRKMDRSIVSLDSSFTEVLGTSDLHYANFVRIRAGDGVILFQTAPMAFSNYFLLYGRNMRYYDNVFSALPARVDKVIWNQYYLYKNQEEDSSSSWWSGLAKLLADPALGPAFRLLLLVLAVYVLLNMKRRQRIIPEIPPKSNESLDFVKTIGRLYYEKGDHRNLAIKMGQHFQEHLRTRYLVQLDPSEESSILRLSSRSGVSETLVRELATMLRYVHDAPSLDEAQLDEWYQLIQTFYKNAQ